MSPSTVSSGCSRIGDLLEQFHARELQQLDRLLQLGRHHQLLGELEALFELHSHRLWSVPDQAWHGDIQEACQR
jgi:hypothetical protein